MTRSEYASRTAKYRETEERRFNLAMASLLADRGYTNLAESHLAAVRDCPRGCPCLGCERTRREAAHAHRRERATAEAA